MQQVDLDRVSEWMSEHIKSLQGSVQAVKFDVGQSNPTYRLDTSCGSYVLRCKPPGVLLKSAHAVDREFRVQRALAGSDVPVPTMLALCQDSSVLDTDFYVMEHVAGRNIVDPSMPNTTRSERRAIITEMSRVLAAIHSVDVDAVGLSDYGPPGHYFERQLVRWTKQYRASETENLPAMEQLITWLAANMPADDGQRTLVHGDFRIDNLLFAPQEPDCVAVLDWELSTLGHPYADLAGVIMQWQLPPGCEGRGLAGMDREELGLPSDAEFIADYCARRGLPMITNFGFYLAFSFFRMGAILQGVKKRALDGNAANPEKGLKLGAFVPHFAHLGLGSKDWRT
ncbi:MAG: phosphotransferase family protein [Pelagimonas sp.]|uniref:phosphotransferase family protein n=1 Tax=Pelagimonas sp. TaxID=2073170 RepID=UPI003D6BF7C7